MKQLLGQAVGPQADLVSGLDPPAITKADLARDKRVMRRVMAQATDLLPTYRPCPNADPYVPKYIRGLRAYLGLH